MEILFHTEQASFSHLPRVKDRLRNFEHDSRKYAGDILSKVKKPLQQVRPDQSVDIILQTLSPEERGYMKHSLDTFISHHTELTPQTSEEVDQDFQTEKKRKQLTRHEILTTLPSILESVSLATVTELGQLPYEEQLMAALAMITSEKGYAINQYTGEGKTLVAAVTASVDALEGKGVHVATANDYLAKRDAAEMGAVYHALGLSVAVVTSDGWQYIYDPEATENGTNLDKLRRIGSQKDDVSGRRDAYLADVTYGQGSEFIFDYLKDSSSLNPNEQRQRGFHSIIIDEIDKVLVDDAVTPAILTSPAEDHVVFSRIINGEHKEFKESDLSILFATLVKDMSRESIFAMLSEEDTTKAPGEKSPTRKEAREKKRQKGRDADNGQKHIDDALRKKGILLEGQSMYDVDTPNTNELHFALWLALRARGLSTLNKDYIIKDNKVQLIEAFGGQVLQGRKYQEGLHAAIEAKEFVDGNFDIANMTPADHIQDAITFQDYMRMYTRLNGMSGTADKVKDELWYGYNHLEVVKIPPHKKMERIDNLTEKVFRTKKEKFDAMVQRIMSTYNDPNSQGRPILIGLQTVKDVLDFTQNYLYPATTAYNQTHEGPHITLQYLTAENSEEEAGIIAQAGRLNTITVSNMTGRGTDIRLGGTPPSNMERQKIIALKGLLAIGEHGTDQTDWQFRGRAGRQGDPGETEFYTSLGDNFIRDYIYPANQTVQAVFNIKKYRDLGYIEGDKGGYAYHIVHDAQLRNKLAEQASAEEQRHEYDIINKHRELYLADRREILTGDPFTLLEGFIEHHIPSTENFQQALDGAILEKAQSNDISPEAVTDHDISILQSQLLYGYENTLAAQVSPEALRTQMLSRVTLLWQDHLASLEIRKAAGLRSQANHTKAYEEFALMAQQELQNFKESVYELLTVYPYSPTVTLPQPSQQPTPQQTQDFNGEASNNPSISVFQRTLPPTAPIRSRNNSDS